MTDAVKAYEEKPRDQWLFDYPAQVSLCGTQIWWTSEVIFFRRESYNVKIYMRYFLDSIRRNCFC